MNRRGGHWSAATPFEAYRKWRHSSLSTDFEAGGGSKVYP